MEFEHIPILLIIGCAILGGTVGARFFQWLRIPQVIGYITVGVLVGKSGLHVVDDSAINSLIPFSFFALGIIGFLIGGELHRNILRKHGSQFVRILLAETMTSFALVFPLISVVTYAFIQDWRISIALGLMLGAISSATAPAATVDVLWEYKTRGILTTTILAIVALDDAIALVLFSLASSAVALLTGSGSIDPLDGLLLTVRELGGAVTLGLGAGSVLNRLVRSNHDAGKSLTSIVGVLTLVIGLARWLELDVILAAMTLGMTLTNLAPNRSRDSFEIVEKFSPPIYALFFVLVGARLTITGLTAWMWAVAAAYIAGRTTGKLIGARMGAVWGKSPASVRKYLGFCLFSQAGVAIGLSIMAGLKLSNVYIGEVSMGNAIVLIIAATTFIVQIIGPPCVKYAVVKAGEAGLDMTENDLLVSTKVAEVYDRETPPFKSQTSVGEILRTLARHPAMSACVVNDQNAVIGMVTMENIKQCCSDDTMTNWLVAFDLMHPVSDFLASDDILRDALQKMKETGLDALPVVADKTSRAYQGILEKNSLERSVARELLRRQSKADHSADDTAA